MGGFSKGPERPSLTRPAPGWRTYCIAPDTTPQIGHGSARGAISSRASSGTAAKPIFLQHNDKRIVFVNPYEGDLALIGTTDIPLEGRAQDARIDQSEIEYLLSVVNRYFENALKFDEVISSFSGVRPSLTTRRPIRAR
jgi:hypothetical protein